MLNWEEYDRIATEIESGLKEAISLITFKVEPFKLAVKRVFGLDAFYIHAHLTVEGIMFEVDRDIPYVKYKNAADKRSFIEYTAYGILADIHQGIREWRP